MKSFLGLIGQFRVHVDHFGDLTAPLYELTEDYKNTKSNKIHWTEKLQQSFDEVKKKVANCPKLFFIDDDHPIYLNTDASNIGNYENVNKKISIYSVLLVRTKNYSATKNILLKNISLCFSKTAPCSSSH